MNETLKNKWVSPSFVYALITQGTSPDLIRLLAKEIPVTQIFEDCAKGFITPKQGAILLEIQRESNIWFVRWFLSLLEKIGF